MVFGPKPRDFRKKVSKSTRHLALRKALSERLLAGDVMILEELKVETPKTKEFVKILAALGLDGTTLVVTSSVEQKLLLASRNVQDVAITTSDSLNSYEVLRPDKLVFTRAAFEKVEQRLKPD